MADLSVAIALSAKDMASGPITAVGKAIGSLSGAAKAPMAALGGLTKGLGAIGLAKMGIDAVAGAAGGLATSLGVGLASEAEQVAAKFNAFTKDAGKTADIMAQVREEANKTPFSFAQMSNAAAGLMPVAKASGAALMDLVKQAEILAASNPAEGLEGAAFALREAVSGDFTSVIERFNLPRQYINQLKAEGVPALEIVSRAMLEMGYDADLVANMAETGAGKWSTFMDAIDGIRMQAAEPIFAALKSELDRLGGALDRYRPQLEALASAVGQFAAGAITSMGGMVERILPYLVKLGDAATLVFRGDFGAAGEALTGTLETVGTSLLTKLGEWGNAIVEWIGPRIQPLLAEAGKFGTALLTWLVDQVPPLTEKLASWAAEFVSWVNSKTPDVMNELGAYASDLFDFVVNSIPELSEKLGRWASAFINWIVDAQRDAIPTRLALLTDLMNWIIEKAPELTRRFIAEWVPAAIAWVAQTAIDVLPKLVDLVLTIGGWIIGTGVPKLAEFAVRMGGAIVTGILQGVANLGAMLMDAIGAQIRQVRIDIGPFHLSAAGFSIDAPPPVRFVTEHVTRNITESIGAIAGRAAGGPVFAGTPYIVGEHRPELFVPSTDGYILPRVPSGGGSSYGGPTAQELAAALAAQPIVIQMDRKEVGRIVRAELLEFGRRNGGVGLS